MDGNFDSQFFLLSILIFFLFPVFSAFVFFLSLSISIRFDLSVLYIFLRLSSFHGIIIIRNFCSVNGNEPV